MKNIKFIPPVIAATTMLTTLGTTAFASVVADLPLIRLPRDAWKTPMEGLAANFFAVAPFGLLIFTVLLGFKLVPAFISRVTGH